MIVRMYTDTEVQIIETEKIDTVIMRYPAIHDTVKIDNPRKVFVPIVRTQYVGDSVEIDIIEQKHYVDSLYEAWVSGVGAQLDSIHVFKRIQFRSVTKSVPVYKYVKTEPEVKRWAFGGFLSGTTSFDIDHANVQGGLELQYKHLSVKGGYNVGEHSYPFVGIEYKIK